jgi:hypothetical protein
MRQKGNHQHPEYRAGKDIQFAKNDPKQDKYQRNGQIKRDVKPDAGFSDMQRYDTR